jgi:hypothetical protein
MQTRAESAVCCRFWQNKGMRRGGREREERNNRWEEMGTSHRVGIGDLQCQYCGAPARNSGSLGAQSEEREGEEWRGRGGGLIGVVGEPFLLRINEGEWGGIGGFGYQ